MGTVYLLHFHRPLPRGVRKKDGKQLFAQHYLGYTDDLVGRILVHSEGGSEAAKIMQALKARGIGFALARTWEGLAATRSFERLCKKTHGSRLCPTCDPKAMNRRKLEYVSPDPINRKRKRKAVKS